MDPATFGRRVRVIVILALFGIAHPASAEPTKCQRKIVKASAQLLQTRTKAMLKCHEAVVKNGVGTCPDSKALATIGKATTKMTAAIGKACGGDDQVCGGDTTNEDLPGTLGWPAACPDFERGACDNPIHDCGDVATCLGCLDGAAVDQAMSLYFGALVLPSTGALNKCQGAIGRAAAAFATAKSKALQKCWDRRIAGKHTSACRAPAPGDDKYQAAIAKAETKMIGTICKACGGSDHGCDQTIGGVVGTGGSDDLAPSAIGFGASCPDVTNPNGPITDCGAVDDTDGAPNVIDSLRELVLCAECVSEFKVDCVDGAQVPTLVRYPLECNACVNGAPTSGPCPTTLEFTVDPDHAELDSGWTGIAHDAVIVANARFTTAVSGCAGMNRPTCGVCDVNGPIPNAGGVTYANRRCVHDTSIQCSGNADCLGVCQGGTNAGEPCNALGDCPDQTLGTSCNGSTCEFFFGAPLSLSAGGVPVCVTNQIVGSITGTFDVEAGSGTTEVNLIARAYPVGTVEQPCPNCKAGVCDSGQRMGMPCTMNGTNLFGDVSFDCPPVQGALAGSLPIRLGTTTGTQTLTLDADSPNCRTTGHTGEKCFCDTCNNINADPCMRDADCPVSGGNPGICGGKRCLGGSNSGNPCAAPSECPGGGCGHPGGMPTAPNACNPPDGAPDGCQPTGDNEGVCVDGPVEKYCSVEYFRSCLFDSDCSCETCKPGQTCNAKLRECYLDNGVIGGSVSVNGEPGPPCEGTFALPTLSALFCIPPTGSTSVNSAGGIPGLGRIRLPGKAVTSP